MLIVVPAAGRTVTTAQRRHRTYRMINCHMSSCDGI
jgi:hypothetical protein